MSQIIRYLSHPQVQIDPAQDITKWSLSEIGHSRVAKLVATGALTGTKTVISSAETKALDTANPIAQALGVTVNIRANMHENDRSATGFLPPNVFEQVADQFFAYPDQSTRGWETARAAQTRIVQEVGRGLEAHRAGDLLFVGHGAVGTLLYCHLKAIPISRAHDQGPGGGGNFLQWMRAAPNDVTSWEPMENLATKTRQPPPKS